MKDTEKKIVKVASPVDIFLKNYLKKRIQNTHLFQALKYGLFSGGKKFRSYLIVTSGKLFNLNSLWPLCKWGPQRKRLHSPRATQAQWSCGVRAWPLRLFRQGRQDVRRSLARRRRHFLPTSCRPHGIRGQGELSWRVWDQELAWNTGWLSELGGRLACCGRSAPSNPWAPNAWQGPT